jgi:hypothetical protein
MRTIRTIFPSNGFSSSLWANWFVHSQRTDLQGLRELRGPREIKEGREIKESMERKEMMGRSGLKEIKARLGLQGLLGSTSVVRCSSPTIVLSCPKAST